ncbi:YppG family protein [Bacillus sp. FJAT-45037]|uniref:YppG family protein n=1 Tax=Bacillus sp. FJAT-45037 TaxID=2011007 RepID=UPI000C23F242|nr:YppG family protein [Bacillus sp. FJAT-45037]
MNYPYHHWSFNQYQQPYYQPYQQRPQLQQNWQMGYSAPGAPTSTQSFFSPGQNQINYANGYQSQPQQSQQNQPWNTKKPSMIKSAFTGENGSFDVGRTFQTVDQVVKTVQQVSPIVKQVSPLVKQVSALFIKR